MLLKKFSLAEKQIERIFLSNNLKNSAKQNSKAKRREFRDREENYPDIHQEISVFERSRAANRYITMSPSFAHE